VSQHPKKRSIVKNNKKNENGVLPYDEWEQYTVTCI
jgi:hypothetical protein